MADALFAVFIVVFISVVAWFLNPFEKLSKSWNRWNARQDRLPEDVRPFSEIPGPRGLPYFGSVIQHIMNSKSIQFAAIHKELFDYYGPIFKETVMGETHVYIKSPRDVEAVLKAEGRHPKRASDLMVALRKYFTSRNKVVASLGLLEGEEWNRFHKAMAPNLLRPKDVRANLKHLSEMARDAIKHMVSIRGSGGSENEIPDLEDFLFKFSAETMGIMMFDLKVGLFDDPPNSETLDMIQAIKDSFTLMGKMNGGLEWFLLKYTCFKSPTYKTFCDDLDAVFGVVEKYASKTMKRLQEMIERGEEFSGNQGVPLLAYLLTKNELELEEAILGTMILFRGGVEVTGTTFAWLFYELASNPSVQERLYEEVSTLVGPDADLNPDSIAKMDYLKACIKEVLRLYPDPIFWSRTLARDAVLSGFHAPAGTKIRYSNFLSRHSEELFSDPLTFKPERWLHASNEEIHPYASIPFGVGRRMCLGRRVAETELYLLTAMIVQRFKLEYHEEPVQVSSAFVLIPDRVLRIKFIDRD